MEHLNQIEQAKSFLTNIAGNILIITHDDLDGFASGILLSDYLDKEAIKHDIHIHNIGAEFPDTIDYDKIIITDLAPNITSDFLKNLNKPCLYIDHHQPSNETLPENIIEYRIHKPYTPATKIVYNLLKELGQEEKQWLAIAGILGDAGEKYENNLKFINNFLNKHDISLKDFQEQVEFKISNFIVYFDTFQKLEQAFYILKNIKDWHNLREIEKYSEEIEQELKQIETDFEENKEQYKINNIYIYPLNPRFKLKSIIIGIISNKYPNDTFLFYVEDKDKPTITFSARNQSGKSDMPELFKQACSGLQASYGGHKAAAGATIKKEDLPKFIKALKEL
ncbi:MAG: DHHA1 domain-containing protein [Candidatus Nanoarchaeia archaeon]